jgi:hypothetical protein
MDDIRSMALRQRRLILVMGLVFLVSLVLSAPGFPFGEAVAIIALLLAVGLSVTCVILVLRLARSMGWNALAQTITAILMFVPWVSVLTLLFVNHKATKVLRSHGLRVGLFGVSRQELKGPSTANV